MVKNKTGGNRHKKQARKNLNAPISYAITNSERRG